MPSIRNEGGLSFMAGPMESAKPVLRIPLRLSSLSASMYQLGWIDAEVTMAEAERSSFFGGYGNQQSSMRRRAVLLAGTAVRLAIGCGYLLAPSRMANLQLAPATDEHPDARLFVRGFGGHQALTGAVTL